LVNIGDRAAANKQTKGEHLITEIGGLPNIGDRVFMHKMPNDEYLTNGISTVNVGDTAMAKRLKGFDKHYYCIENGGDDTCLRGLSPTKIIDHNCEASIFSINGGWSFLFKLDKPMYVESWQPFPLMYITTFDRRPVQGEGEIPIVDDATGDILSIQGADFQNWYPYGRLRFGFSTDGLPQGCPSKSWFGTDGLDMSLGGQNFRQLIEVGDVTLNADQNTYLYPSSESGMWVWREPQYITDIWVHVRNTSSFAWCASGETKVSKLRICYQDHPEFIDEGMGSGGNVISEDWRNCMIQYSEAHPELTDAQIMNYCNQYV
jgi:hypothetical protein